jgi:uncharacterized protein YdeI (YjbR/CyaY-like superfamily)
MTERETFYPTDILEWRQWLQEHHASKQSVWLICYRKDSDIPSISWSDSVDEALCFGWIDSTRRSIDHESFMQYFCRRKPKSNWSKVNKEKVQQLIADGRMTKAGLDSIEIAKQNGSWNILDEVEELLIPDDLEAAFGKHDGASEFFLGLSKSVRKMMLHWVMSAKQDETRKKRIQEIAEHAARGEKPERFG